MHHVGAVVVHLPLEDREVGLDGRGVVEDGRQPAAVCTETLPSPRGNVPGDVELSAAVVQVDGAAKDEVGRVGLHQLAMVGLDLVDGLRRPEALEVLAVRIQHVPHEVAVSKNDQLIRQYRWRVLLQGQIVVVALNPDASQVSMTSFTVNSNASRLRYLPKCDPRELRPQDCS